MAVINCGKRVQPMHYSHYHSHDNWELILNLEGYGENLFKNGVSYPFSPGSIICIPPGVYHSKISEDSFKDIYIESTDFMADEAHEILTYQDDDDKTVETLIHLVHNIFHKKEPNYNNTTRALIDAISNILIGKRQMPARSPAIRQIIHLMVENFTDPEFTASKALASQSYCIDYLRRVFKKEMNMTPGAYLTRLRIAQAKMQLRQKPDSGTTIGDIALICGFYDARYFSRVFKQYTGLTPMEYANSHAGSDSGLTRSTGQQ